MARSSATSASGLVRARKCGNVVVSGQRISLCRLAFMTTNETTPYRPHAAAAANLRETRNRIGSQQLRDLSAADSKSEMLLGSRGLAVSHKPPTFALDGRHNVIIEENNPRIRKIKR
mmetsp:Transcript_8397/g.12286  ORF Transcript_8397/g.12286 Transcript_8397/m.12286 type:complete len:117 (-) Transcript_8397:725-1075(-)